MPKLGIRVSWRKKKYHIYQVSTSKTASFELLERYFSHLNIARVRFLKKISRISKNSLTNKQKIKILNSSKPLPPLILTDQTIPINNPKNKTKSFLCNVLNMTPSILYLCVWSCFVDLWMVLVEGLWCKAVGQG